MGFYEEFEENLRTQWLAYKSKHRQLKMPDISEPEFWKSNGDELLYVFELRDAIDASAIVGTWLKTLRSYREQLKKNTPQLDVKSSGWIAGFPVMNSEIIFKKGLDVASVEIQPASQLKRQFDLLSRWYDGDATQRADLVKDYVGPSIDTGFRIGAWATPRRFAISVDLALLLTAVTLPHGAEEPKFFFDDSHALKGVVGGKPYPRILVDVGDSREVDKLHDRLMRAEYADKESLRKYCEEYVTQNKDYLMRPFMVSAKETMWSDQPEGYGEELRKWAERLKEEESRTDSIRSSAEGGNGEGAVLEAAEVQDFAVSVAPKKRGRKR